MVLTRWQNTWCYSAQLTTGPGGTSGQEESLTWILNSTPLGLLGADWGGDPPPLHPHSPDWE